MNDWMQVVKSPIRYRVGDKRLNFKLNAKLVKMTLTVSFVLFIIYFLISRNNEKLTETNLGDELTPRKFYNTIYPLTRPLKDKSAQTTTYQLMAIADLDTNSKHVDDGKTKYISYMLKGTLTISDSLDRASISFEASSREISSQYSYGDRGMELSELIVFNGKLYSCDDRTGIIYEIRADKSEAIPWVVLADGDGTNAKGFKCEWMTVRCRNQIKHLDCHLYVGGLGKEWTTSKGALVNHNPQWIKMVSVSGEVKHVDWTENYDKIRMEGGYLFPGYMIFESGVWNEIEKRWMFLPRRASKDSYDELLDEKRATNLLITVDESFNEVTYKKIGELMPLRGYSSFKFVPNTNNRVVIALKTEEDSGQTRSFVTLFDLNGNILVKDKLISDTMKYEGIEFV